MHIAPTWLEQINSVVQPSVGFPIEALLPVVITLLLYIGFEIIHNVETHEAELADAEARRSWRRRI